MDEEDLDTSWIKEHQILTDIETNYEPEPMTRIPVKFIYININRYIEKIKTIHIELLATAEHTHRTIPTHVIMKLIQDNQLKTNNSKYFLQDIMWYNVELKPENIQKSVDSPDTFAPFFKTIHIVQLEDIILQPSIFIFHDLNCLYFVYQEREMELVNNQRRKIKSILKTVKNREDDEEETEKKAATSSTKDTSTKDTSTTKKVQIDLSSLRKSKKRKIEIK